MLNLSRSYNNELSSSELAKLKNQKFSHTGALKMLRDINNKKDDIDCEQMCDLLLEFVKILNEMSSALGIAFKGSTQYT